MSIPSASPSNFFTYYTNSKIESEKFDWKQAVRNDAILLVVQSAFHALIAYLRSASIAPFVGKNMVIFTMQSLINLGTDQLAKDGYIQQSTKDIIDTVVNTTCTGAIIAVGISHKLIPRTLGIVLIASIVFVGIAALAVRSIPYYFEERNMSTEAKATLVNLRKVEIAEEANVKAVFDHELPFAL